MIAIPVLDVRHGLCRQAGNVASFPECGTDPNSFLRTLTRFGFTRFHISATDPLYSTRGFRPGSSFLSDDSIQLQIAADVRRRERVDDLLSVGASYVVVDPVSPGDDDSLAELLSRDSRSIIVAIDVCARHLRARAGQVGWPADAADWIDEHLGDEIGAVLVRAVDAQGRPSPCDLAFLEDLVSSRSTPVLAEGIYEALGELDALQDRGVAGALLGEGLFSGRIDPWAAAQEFSA